MKTFALVRADSHKINQYRPGYKPTESVVNKDYSYVTAETRREAWKLLARRRNQDRKLVFPHISDMITHGDWDIIEVPSNKPKEQPKQAEFNFESYFYEHL